MTKGHFQSAGGRIEHRDAKCLFPVEELDATVSQYRDAELVLDDASGDDVIIVAPTSLASSYALIQRPLTAIVVDSLPTEIKAQLDDALEAPIESFHLIQIGKWNASSPNRSLGEFTDA